MTQADQVAECIKVNNSFLYFLETYVWIEDKENKCPIKMVPWPAQAQIAPQIALELLLILLKTRQVGLTWIAAAYALWQALRSQIYLAVVISASEDHAIEFLGRLTFILDRLPGWLVPPIAKQTKMEIGFQHKTNTLATIKSMPTIEMGAESKTPNLLIIDEAHTIREVKSIFNSSYPGIEQAKGQVVIIANSVKSGPGWPFVRDMYLDSISGQNKFRRIFLPWYSHPGRPADFRERMIEAGMAKEDVIWHYPATEDEAISSINSSYFGDALARHKYAKRGVVGNFVRDPQTKEVSFSPEKNGLVELWRFPYGKVKTWDGYIWTNRYCMGSDVSEGLGLSFSIGYVMDRVLDELICKVRSNRIDAHRWAEILSMASDYYERALITVERTGAGQSTVQHLETLKANQSIKILPAKVGGGITRDIGWTETSESKKYLCQQLRRWLKEMRGTLWDAELLGQCQTWIQDERGRLGPEEGKYGDCVMAAGCMIQADQFLPEPEKIVPEVEGWEKRWREEKSKGGAWSA
jgi:hypothetical protein